MFYSYRDLISFFTKQTIPTITMTATKAPNADDPTYRYMYDTSVCNASEEENTNNIIIIIFTGQ